MKNKYALPSKEAYLKAKEDTKAWQKYEVFSHRGYIENNNELYFFLKGKDKIKVNYAEYKSIIQLTDSGEK